MKCPKCGNVIPSDVKFCAYCGKSSATLSTHASIVGSRRALATWLKWVIGLTVAGLILALVFGIAFHSFSDPLDKAYNGAFRWAKHNLPSEKHVTIPQSGFPTDATGLMESEVTHCTIVGKHAWATAYYGLRTYYDTRVNPRATLHELFPPVGYILYSSDGGGRWGVQKQISNWVPFRLKFMTDTEGYAFGDSGILYTSDSGKHWIFLDLPAGVQEIVALESIEGYHLVIACNDDWAKYESFDGGKTWQKRSE